MEGQFGLQASAAGDTQGSTEPSLQQNSFALPTRVRTDTELKRETAVPWQDFEHDLLELCAQKADEFHMLGYEEVTASEVWQCVLKLTKGQGALHEMVGAVIGLQVGKFMNYTTINAYRGIFDESQFDVGNRA